MINKKVPSLEGWKDIVSEILEKINSSDEKATIIALSGDLGVGKTTFVQQLAGVLGVPDPVTSPTFVLMKQYETNSQKFKTLLHMDAYRIDSEEELRPLRFDELLKKPKTLFCIEWAEKIKNSLPKDTLYFHLEIDQDNQHTIQSVS